MTPGDKLLGRLLGRPPSLATQALPTLPAQPVGLQLLLDGQGRVNLAPYSFFAGLNSSPPMVGYAVEKRKDSMRNVEETGEFVCNLVSRELAEAMNETCAPLPPEPEIAVHADTMIVSPFRDGDRLGRIFRTQPPLDGRLERLAALTA